MIQKEKVALKVTYEKMRILEKEISTSPIVGI
jgi:cell fate (sporulation/competence/biofilm development) regulator YmcA (YheA/YmcA/DUF963 family)